MGGTPPGIPYSAHALCIEKRACLVLAGQQVNARARARPEHQHGGHAGNRWRGDADEGVVQRYVRRWRPVPFGIYARPEAEWTHGIVARTESLEVRNEACSAHARSQASMHLMSVQSAVRLEHVRQCGVGSFPSRPEPIERAGIR